MCNPSSKRRKECVAVRKWAISTVSSAVLMTATAMTDCSVLSSPHRPEGTQPHTTGAATSKTSAASDYSRLLIKPNAIGGLDETDTAQPPTLNPHGVPGASVVFVNKANTRAVGNTIFVLPDPDAATAALNGAKKALGTVIEGAVAQPAPVGANGTTAGGPSPDGSKAVTVGDVHRRRDFRHAQVRRCDDRCGRAATGEPGRPATRRADQDSPHLNLFGPRLTSADAGYQQRRGGVAADGVMVRWLDRVRQAVQTGRSLETSGPTPCGPGCEAWCCCWHSAAQPSRPPFCPALRIPPTRSGSSAPQPS